MGRATAMVRLASMCAALRRNTPSPGASAIARQLREVLALLETGFLGLEHDCGARAIARSGWQPDSPGAWCPRCASSVRGGVADLRLGCPRCAGAAQPPLGDAAVRLGEYDGALREWLLQLKYARHRDLGVALGGILARQIELAVPASRLGRCGGPVVVPMPMPYWRREHRGIDHAAVLAEAVAASLGGPCHHALARGGGAPPQTGRSRRERRRSGGRGLTLVARLGGPAQWMGLSRSREYGNGLEGRSVVLVDDVRTTGTSHAAAVRLLRRGHPAEIIVAVAACAEPRWGPVEGSADAELASPRVG